MDERVQTVRARIVAACRRCGRDPHSVRLIGVTKGRSSEQVAALLAAGVAELGENYIQEARVKRTQLNASVQRSTPSVQQIRWHLIGHLQRNKATAAVELFDVIHSVDSPTLATALDRQIAANPGRSGQPLDVLIQINVSGEAAKSGVTPEDAPALVQTVRGLPQLRLLGFMTMAPPPAVAPTARRPEGRPPPSAETADGRVAPAVVNAEMARPYFRQLRQLRDAINPRLTELSMGMSDDFEVAIEEGATMVRIGRALFETGDRRHETG